MTALVHVLAGGPADVERRVKASIWSTALCGTRWVPTVADPDGPVCGVCVRALIAVVDSRATLAERQARYLEVRQHTLSTAGIVTLDRFDAQARYVRGEAIELWTAVCDYVDALNASQFESNPADFTVDELRHVRHEIADVVLATVTLAGMLPGDVTVEACIDEKTEDDRGRG